MSLYRKQAEKHEPDTKKDVDPEDALDVLRRQVRLRATSWAADTERLAKHDEYMRNFKEAQDNYNIWREVFILRLGVGETIEQADQIAKQAFDLMKERTPKFKDYYGENKDGSQE